MRKIASEHMGHKGVDEVSFAQMGGWENEIAKAYQECYKRTIDWATTARKLSGGFHPAPSCHVAHMDYPIDFPVSPFPAHAASDDTWSIRDHRTNTLQSILAKVVHRVGGMMWMRYKKSPIWDQFAMFRDPRWPAYAAKVSEWTTKHKEDAAATAEQVVCDAMGTINSGLSAKMTQVDNRMLQVIDVISKLLNVTDDGGNLQKLTEVIEVQAQTIASQQTSMVELQVALSAKDAEISALRATLALAATGEGAEERPSSGGAAAAAAAAVAVAAATGRHSNPERYQAGDEKLISMDVSFRDFGARYHKKPASFGRRSVGELVAAAGTVKEFLGSTSAGSRLRSFQKAAHLDAYILEHFKVDGGQATDTTLSEHKCKSYVLADLHYEKVYANVSSFYNNAVQQKKATIQCTATLSCSGRVVKTKKPTQRSCKACGSKACSSCGASWSDGHSC